MDEARQQTEELASGATQAYGSVKQLLNLSFSNGLETQMDHEGIMISENGSSPDGREGMLAFAEKLTFNHTEMDKDDIESLKAVGFSDENILDIIASVAYRNFSNRLNIAIGLDEDVTEGDQDLLNIAKSGHSMSMV